MKGSKTKGKKIIHCHESKKRRNLTGKKFFYSGVGNKKTSKKVREYRKRIFVAIR